MWAVSRLAGCGVSSTAAFTSWVCDKSYLIILLLIRLVTNYDQVPDFCSAGNAEDVAIAVHVRPLSGCGIHQHWAGGCPATANETGQQAATKETKEEEAESQQQQSDQQSSAAKSHGVELFGRRWRRRPTGGSLEPGKGRNQSTPTVRIEPFI